MPALIPKSKSKVEMRARKSRKSFPDSERSSQPSTSAESEATTAQQFIGLTNDGQLVSKFSKSLSDIDDMGVKKQKPGLGSSKVGVLVLCAIVSLFGVVSFLNEAATSGSLLSNLTSGLRSSDGKDDNKDTDSKCGCCGCKKHDSVRGSAPTKLNFDATCVDNTDCNSEICGNFGSNGKKCLKGLNDKPCKDNNDCASNKCESYKCKGSDLTSSLAEFDKACDKDADCMSGSCSSKKCAKGANGTVCKAKTDCLSSECLNFACVAQEAATVVTNHVAVGGECTTGADCDSGVCTADAAGSMKCGQGSKNIGAQCTHNGQCQAKNCSSYTSKCATNGLNGFCAADGDCSGPFVCETGACKVKLSLKSFAAQCITQNDCLSSNCQANACAKGADSKPCLAATDCSSGTCTGNVCGAQAAQAQISQDDANTQPQQTHSGKQCSAMTDALCGRGYQLRTAASTPAFSATATCSTAPCTECCEVFDDDCSVDIDGTTAAVTPSTKCTGDMKMMPACCFRGGKGFAYKGDAADNFTDAGFLANLPDNSPWKDTFNTATNPHLAKAVLMHLEDTALAPGSTAVDGDAYNDQANRESSVAAPGTDASEKPQIVTLPKSATCTDCKDSQLSAWNYSTKCTEEDLKETFPAIYASLDLGKQSFEQVVAIFNNKDLTDDERKQQLIAAGWGTLLSSFGVLGEWTKDYDSGEASQMPMARWPGCIAHGFSIETQKIGSKNYMFIKFRDDGGQIEELVQYLDLPADMGMNGVGAVLSDLMVLAAMNQEIGRLMTVADKTECLSQDTWMCKASDNDDKSANPFRKNNVFPTKIDKVFCVGSGRGGALCELLTSMLDLGFKEADGTTDNPTMASSYLATNAFTFKGIDEDAEAVESRKDERNTEYTQCRAEFTAQCTGVKWYQVAKLTSCGLKETACAAKKGWSWFTDTITNLPQVFRVKMANILVLNSRAANWNWMRLIRAALWTDVGVKLPAEQFQAITLNKKVPWIAAGAPTEKVNFANVTGRFTDLDTTANAWQRGDIKPAATDDCTTCKSMKFGYCRGKNGDTSKDTYCDNVITSESTLSPEDYNTHCNANTSCEFHDRPDYCSKCYNQQVTNQLRAANVLSIFVGASFPTHMQGIPGFGRVLSQTDMIYLSNDDTTGADNKYCLASMDEEFKQTPFWKTQIAEVESQLKKIPGAMSNAVTTFSAEVSADGTTLISTLPAAVTESIDAADTSAKAALSSDLSTVIAAGSTQLDDGQKQNSNMASSFLSGLVQNSNPLLISGANLDAVKVDGNKIVTDMIAAAMTAFKDALEGAGVNNALLEMTMSLLDAVKATIQYRDNLANAWLVHIQPPLIKAVAELAAYILPKIAHSVSAATAEIKMIFTSVETALKDLLVKSGYGTEPKKAYFIPGALDANANVHALNPILSGWFLFLKGLIPIVTGFLNNVGGVITATLKATVEPAGNQIAQAIATATGNNSGAACSTMWANDAACAGANPQSVAENAAKLQATAKCAATPCVAATDVNTCCVAEGQVVAAGQLAMAAGDSFVNIFTSDAVMKNIVSQIAALSTGDFTKARDFVTGFFEEKAVLANAMAVVKKRSGIAF